MILENMKEFPLFGIKKNADTMEELPIKDLFLGLQTTISAFSSR